MTFDLPLSMAAGTEFSPPPSVPEVGSNKDNAAALEDEVSDLKQMTNRKPPRYSSTLRHNVSSIGPLTTDDLSDDDNVSTKSPSNKRSGFLPVFRSGSCAERGPKQYMEDEHVCIDNLVEHLGDTDDFSSPRAFYGILTIPLSEKAHKEGNLSAPTCVVDGAYWVEPETMSTCVVDGDIITGATCDAHPEFIRLFIKALGGIITGSGHQD